MARLIGIDVGPAHVRVAVLTSSYRRYTLERTLEVDRNLELSLKEALRSAVGPLLQQGASVGIAIDGERIFFHHIELPVTATRQLERVVPFELEARVPVDIEELVHDFVLLREKRDENSVRVLAAAARLTMVRELLDTCRDALGREVERVGCGPLPLANLVPLARGDLGAPGPIALLDVGTRNIEVLILKNGEPAFCRTASIGIEGLPGNAERLALELRQTLVSYAAEGGEVPNVAYLMGAGARIPGAEAYLSHHLELSVLPMPRLDLAGLSDADVEVLPKFAKAISVALGLGTRPRDVDLRQGELAFQRGYAFIKEKAPIVSGLIASVVISFLFATWAELRALDRKQEQLSDELGQVSSAVLGQRLEEPEAALDLLQKRRAADEPDPMPHMDGFDVMVEVSKAVPTTITHDIEELDVQREHVKLTGILGSAAEAQQIVSRLQENRCFSDVRLGKVTQVINSDRQKYGAEWDIRCPEDQVGKSTKKKSDQTTRGVQ